MKSILIFILTFLTLTSYSQKEEFTIIVENPTTSIKDQMESGPCWSYATCSFIESELLRLNKGTYNLSEDFFVYYAYVDKAHNYVLRQGETSFRSGGLAHDVLRIIKEKGIVPDHYFKIDYIRNTGEVQEVLSSYLNATLKSDYPTENWMKHYHALLDSYYDPLPKQFEVKGQDFTPVSFTKFLEINTDEYISLTSFTHHPFNKNFVLELRDNYANDLFYNVPINELIQIIDTALIRGYTIVWDGSISKTFSANDNGLALLPQAGLKRNEKIDANTLEINVNQQIRQLSFERLQTTDDHLMHIIGLSKDKAGKKFYKIKDSEGVVGPYSGYIYMSESYLKMKTVSIMLNKNSLPKETKKRIDKK